MKYKFSLLIMLTACQAGITHDLEKVYEDTSEEVVENEETIVEDADEETTTTKKAKRNTEP